MGSCVSIHKEVESAEKHGVKDEKGLGLMKNSSVKEKGNTVNGGDLVDDDDPVLKPSGFHGGGGSKDEAFFDSQPWLDSDCENDYHSVNGDLTPSCGSTPVHHSFQPSIQPTTIKVLIQQLTDDNNSAPEEASPTGNRKKRLSELFRESLGGDELQYKEFQKSTNGTDSGINNEKTHNNETNGDDKEANSSQCCIPKLIRSRSLDAKRKKMSPARAVD